MEFLFLESWSPYLVGVLIGLLNIVAMIISGKALGASTSFVKVGAYLVKVVDKEKVKSNSYYQKHKPQLDWGIMLVFGIVIGAFLASLLSGDFIV